MEDRAAGPPARRLVGAGARSACPRMPVCGEKRVNSEALMAFEWLFSLELGAEESFGTRNPTARPLPVDSERNLVCMCDGRRPGIEDVNHELYGGLYSQMLVGESFEE